MREMHRKFLAASVPKTEGDAARCANLLGLKEIELAPFSCKCGIHFALNHLPIS